MPQLLSFLPAVPALIFPPACDSPNGLASDGPAGNAGDGCWPGNVGLGGSIDTVGMLVEGSCLSTARSGARGDAASSVVVCLSSSSPSCSPVTSTAPAPSADTLPPLPIAVLFEPLAFPLLLSPRTDLASRSENVDTAPSSLGLYFLRLPPPLSAAADGALKEEKPIEAIIAALSARSVSGSSLMGDGFAIVSLPRKLSFSNGV